MADIGSKCVETPGDEPQGSNLNQRDFAEASRLCEVCSTIDFVAYFTRAVNSQVDRNRYLPSASTEASRLGFLADVYQKSQTCSFCYLVVQAICTMSVYYETTPEELMVKERAKTEPTECWIYSYCWAWIENQPSSKAYRIGIASRVNEEGEVLSRADQIGDIQLLSSDSRRTLGSALFSGRRIGKNPELRQILQWLSLCEQEHGTLCRDTASQEPQDLFVIDVQRGCICQLPKGTRYAALSYCWPPQGAFKTVTSNLSQLSRPGALRDQHELVPQVIKDTIDFVYQIGEQYLWVDALCIIQDNDDHKARQIAQMASVYSSAFITIVPALSTLEPDKACAGLPRYNSTIPSREQKISRVDSMELAVPFEAVFGLVTSKCRWSTRAWTYQECLLSPRILFFTPSQVYFQCRCSVFCEDCVGEVDYASTFFTPCTNLWNSGAPHAYSGALLSFGSFHLDVEPYPTPVRALSAYEICVQDYSNRKLTFTSDALNAFLGIQNAMQRLMKTRFLFGLPERFLDIALLFVTIGSRRRTIDASGGQLRNHVAPSWSWMGWNCAVDLGMYFPARLSMVKREVDWHVIDSTGIATVLNPEVHRMGEAAKVDERINPSPSPGGGSPSYTDSTLKAHTQGMPELSILTCWTTVAEFQLDGTVASLGQSVQMWPSAKHLTISNYKGQWAGSILMEQDWVEKNVQLTRLCKFILLSRSKELGSVASRIPAAFDLKMFPIREWCFMNVMLVEWVGGVAQRLGAGVIHEDAWNLASPSRISVVMA